MARVDLAEINFIQLIDDFKSIIDRISPDCLLSGWNSKYVFDTFNKHKIFRKDDMDEASKIMLELMDDDKYARELKMWIV